MWMGWLTMQGSSIVDLVKMTCKDVEEMEYSSILIERLALLSNLTGNVLALLVFTVYDVRNLVFEASEASKKLKKLKEQEREQEEERQRLEAEAKKEAVAAVFEVESTPEARAARRLRLGNRQSSRFKSLRNMAGAATTAAAKSVEASTLLNLDRGKLSRAIAFYSCVWTYVAVHVSIIYATDITPKREREILFPLGMLVLFVSLYLVPRGDWSRWCRMREPSGDGAGSGGEAGDDDDEEKQQSGGGRRWGMGGKRPSTPGVRGGAAAAAAVVAAGATTVGSGGAALAEEGAGADGEGDDWSALTASGRLAVGRRHFGGAIADFEEDVPYDDGDDDDDDDDDDDEGGGEKEEELMLANPPALLFGP
jgi:hypothetical protein